MKQNYLNTNLCIDERGKFVSLCLKIVKVSEVTIEFGSAFHVLIILLEKNFCLNGVVESDFSRYNV